MVHRVKLDEIIEGLEFQSDERHSFLDKRIGKVVSMSDEEMQAAEDDEPIEDDWYKHPHDALKQIAIEWCQENGIQFEE
jgi:hypothetical protein